MKNLCFSARSAFGITTLTINQLLRGHKMKSIFAALALTSVSAISTLAHASSSAQTIKIEAAAVLNNAEIAAHLKLEIQSHHLICEKENLEDVTITDDAAMDAFEVVYGCRSAAGNESAERIHFTGGVYTESPSAKHAQAILTGMSIDFMD